MDILTKNILLSIDLYVKLLMSVFKLNKRERERERETERERQRERETEREMR